MAARKKVTIPGNLTTEGSTETGYRWKWESPQGSVSFSTTRFLSRSAASAAGRATVAKNLGLGDEQ